MNFSEIMRRYKQIPSGVKAMFWFTVCNFLQKGIQYMTLPLFTRILTVEEYGQYILFISWMSIITIFSTLNLSAGIYTRGMVAYEDNRDYFTSAMLGASWFVAGTVSIVYFCFRESVNRLLNLNTAYVVLILLQSFFSSAYLFWAVRQRFEYRYKKLLVLTIVGSLLSPLTSLILLCFCKNSLFSICFGYISGQVFMGGLCAFGEIKKERRLLDFGIWKEALQYNVPLIPHYLSYVILGQADRVMISWMCGAGETGIYGLAYQVSNLLNLLTNALDSAVTPKIYGEIKYQRRNLQDTVNLLLMFFAMIIVMASLLAPEILGFFGSDKYGNGKWLMPPIMLSAYFLFLAGLFMKVEIYFKKNLFITAASASIAVLNLILNAVFIPKAGYYAAAYTTLFCYMGFAWMHFLSAERIIKKQEIRVKLYDLKGISTISAGAVLVTEAIVFLYYFKIIRYILLFLLLCFPCMKFQAIVGYIRMADASEN